MRLRVGWIFAIIAVVAIPGVTARAPVTAEFSVGGTTELHGVGHAVIQSTGLTLLPASKQEISFKGDYRIVLRSSPRFYLDSDPLTGPGNMPGDDWTHEEWQATSGSIQTRENATLVVVPRHASGHLDLPCQDGDLRLDLPVQPETSFQAIFERPIQPLNSSFSATCSAADISVDGDMLILVYDAVINLPDGPIETGPQTYAAPRLPGASVEAGSQYYAILVGSGQASGLRAASWDVAASFVEGTINGTLVATDVQVASSTPSLPERMALLQLEGEMRYRLGPNAASLSGEVSRIRVDGQIVRQDGDLTEEVAVAVGVLGLLALLHWFVLGYIRATPLGNETRREILALVSQGAGASVGSLCQQVGVKRPTVYFHANILARAGLVTLHKRGTSWHVLPSGLPQHGVVLAATINHPIRRAIHGILQACGPTSSSGLARAVTQSGVPVNSSMLTYHLQILVGEGVISREQSGKRAVYSLRADATGLASEQPATSEV